MIPNIGPMEIGIVLVIALIVFGPKKLPSLGHSLGNGIREFRQGITEQTTPEVEQLEPAPVPVAEAPVESREVAG